MVSLKRIVRLYALYAKMDLAWLLRDKMFASVAIISDVISNLSAVTGVFLLAWRFGGLGGMSRYEVLFMLAYVTIVTGLFQTFFSGCNTGHISRVIGRGQLEHIYIQPLPIPVQLATSGFCPFSGGSNIISGAFIMVIAVSNIGSALPWWWIPALLGNLAVTMALIIGQSYLFSCITFYIPVTAEEISSYIIDSFGYISTFPLSGMPVWLQYPLITAIPTGLLAWFPTLALFGRTPFGLSAWYPLLPAVIIWAAVLYFFRKGLNYYVKKGINRYHPMGHRR